MRREDINIRDPFVLVYDNTYYMYGTRGETCWGEATGFDCYISKDLENWSEAIEVFHKPEGFWADMNCWAPEVYAYEGSFYMFATFKSSHLHGGTAILKADSPTGPFIEHSDRQITPKDWECIDGTFYQAEDGRVYMVFVHEWVQISDGAICAVELSKDLKQAIGGPVDLFHASEATGWVKTITNKHRPGNHYVTDGPFLYQTQNDKLVMLWSSFGEEGYTEALAYHEGNGIVGKWTQDDRLLFKKDGGHGMIFKDLQGRLLLTLHSPNEHLKEYPHFYELKEKDDTLWLI